MKRHKGADFEKVPFFTVLKGFFAEKFCRICIYFVVSKDNFTKNIKFFAVSFYSFCRFFAFCLLILA
jgi:hypothetical protein